MRKVIVIALSCLALQNCYSGIKTKQDIIELLQTLPAPASYLSLECILDKCGVNLHGVDIEQVITDIVNRIQQQNPSLYGPSQLDFSQQFHSEQADFGQQYESAVQDFSQQYHYQPLQNDFSQQYPEPESISALRSLFLIIPYQILQALTQINNRIPVPTANQAKLLFLLALIAKQLVNFRTGKEVQLSDDPTVFYNTSLLSEICLPEDRPDSALGSMEPETDFQPEELAEHEDQAFDMVFTMPSPSRDDTEKKVQISPVLPPSQTPEPAMAEEQPENSRPWSACIIPSGYSFAMGFALALGATPCTGYEIQLLRNSGMVSKSRRYQGMPRAVRWAGCSIIAIFSLVTTDIYFSTETRSTVTPAPEKPGRSRTRPRKKCKQKVVQPDFVFDSEEYEEYIDDHAARTSPELVETVTTPAGTSENSTLQNNSYIRVYQTGGLTGLGCAIETATLAAAADLLFVVLLPRPLIRIPFATGIAAFYLPECNRRSESLRLVDKTNPGEAGKESITGHDYITYMANSIYITFLYKHARDVFNQMDFQQQLSGSLQLHLLVYAGISLTYYWTFYVVGWIVLEASYFAF